ncbi:DUF5984 family protein [Streptomyces sp. NBC_00390]|uniref:DUF5984 family protein n=1 Tax=Streptomyces sp. NBC_00390 TaxID=2975736 RepID=UPI002E21143D
MIRFRFDLRPVAGIQPWGGDDPSLHWFALTEGWYWIEAGGHELLRYSERTLHRWAGEEGGGTATSPYAAYYVVRLWEDVIEMLPEVLEPVPEDLVGFVAADLGDWPSRENTPEAEAAGLWHSDRSMYMGPLRNAPHIRWWRTIIDGDDAVTVSWQHRSDSEIEFAGPPEGTATVPTRSFVAAVAEFDRALLAAMDERITALEAAGPPPGVGLDLRHLRREQQERAGRLQQARARECDTDWDVIRAGARELLAAGAGPAPGSS